MNQEKFVIYDNVLPNDTFKKMTDSIIEDGGIPWYYTKDVSGGGVEEVCYFTHLFYRFDGLEPQKSDWYNLVLPIVEVLNCNSLIRIKGNLYPRTNILHHNLNHIDYEFPHNGAIFYLNTNDGYTILNDEHKIESVENRLLLFDSRVPHRSTNCTNKHFRANINFNYF